MSWKLEYDGTNQSFEAWGLGPPMLTRTNQGADLLRLRQGVTAADQDPLFAYGEELIIRRPDNTIWFRGRCRANEVIGSGREQTIQYEVAGPWWDFERVVFQQGWPIFNGWNTPGDPSSGAT